MKLFGLYSCEQIHNAIGIYDCPCVITGGHALCAEDVTTFGGVTAAVVGRIRNRDELKETPGIRAALRRDIDRPSALIAAAYRLWGAEFPRHIEGPCAAVVFDQARERLVLSRDRMGEIPLIYARRGRGVAFALHPSALIAARAVKPAVGRTELNELFALGPARSPGMTFLRGVRALLPGHTLIADAGGVQTRRYYSLEAAEHADDEKTTVEKVRDLISRATFETEALNPGMMLSGGLDSTVLTALCARKSAAMPRSFSVDYEGNAKYFRGTDFQPASDARFVEMACRHIGTQHTRVELTQESLAGSLSDAMRARGWPGMADVDGSLLLFAREIAKNCRYVISGECADEVFGGYPWFEGDARAIDRFPWSDSLPLRARILKKSVREKLMPEQYIADRLHEALDGLSVLPGEAAEDAYFRAVQGLCFAYFMPNLQERAFAMCADAGLTVLTPYCDDRLAAYLYNVPWRVKRLGGHRKGLLRAAARDLLPDELLYRKKSPYPKTYHPAYTALVRERAVQMLSDPASPILTLIDKDAVLAIAQSPLLPGDYPWYGQLMAGPQMLAYLIQVNDWLRENQVEIDL